MINSKRNGRRKELDKIIEKETKTLITIGEKLLNKSEKRILLEAAYKSWENLSDFVKAQIPQKNNFFKDYLEKEYIEIAKKHIKKEKIKAKWESLEKE